MEFGDVVRGRRMVRSYTAEPVPRTIVDRVIDAGLRAPSAGFTQGVQIVALEGEPETSRFWATIATSPKSPEAGGRWAGMRTAPLIVLPLSDKASYLARYAEPDKAALGLHDEARWPVPYWDIDAAFATMSMLLAATDAGLGALFFGVDHGEDELLALLGVPDGLRLIGAITIGWPAADDTPSPSLKRGRRPRAERVHYGKWTP
ncbi:MAG: nitroreductase family protein [Acidimicrobiales bacterium]